MDNYLFEKIKKFQNLIELIQMNGGIKESAKTINVKLN